MIRFITLIHLSFFFFSATLSAQTPEIPCGTIGDFSKQLSVRLKENIASLRMHPIIHRDFFYVPLTFHIVARNNGTGGATEKDIFAQLCEMNHTYASVGLIFYIKQFDYINNTVIFENSSGASFLMNAKRDISSINIWCVKDASAPGVNIGTTLGHYNPLYDWIVIRNDELGRNKKTLPHEMGHFFSLIHPHNGWDNEPYDPAIHGNPVQATSPMGIPTELQDGSNCANSGDFVCDTPPDYNFGFGWDNCDYDAGTMDPHGVIVDPQEVNLMAYFLHCAPDDYQFTNTQRDLILTDYHSAHRNYVRQDNPPIYGEITEVPQLSSPVDGETTNYYNAVNFEWNAISGATYYILEIANNGAFSESHSFLVYGNTKTISDIFEEGTTYYWSVRGVNAVNSCEGLSPVETFKTGISTATNDLKTNPVINVFPNPVSENNSLNIQLMANQLFYGNIRLADLTGKQITPPLIHEFSRKKNTFQLPIPRLKPGIYVLNITNKYTSISKKIIVMNQ